MNRAIALLVGLFAVPLLADVTGNDTMDLIPPNSKLTVTFRDDNIKPGVDHLYFFNKTLYDSKSKMPLERYPYCDMTLVPSDNDRQFKGSKTFKLEKRPRISPDLGVDAAQIILPPVSKTIVGLVCWTGGENRPPTINEFLGALGEYGDLDLALPIKTQP
jgi:hypothetical protein